MGNPNAESRSTDIASLLESFLDDHKDDLSPNMFSQLDSLAGKIDEEVEKLEEEVTDMESEIEQFRNDMEILENRIKEMEEDQ